MNRIGYKLKYEESEDLKFFKMNEIPANITKTLKNILNDLKRRD